MYNIRIIRDNRVSVCMYGKYNINLYVQIFWKEVKWLS